MIRLARAKSVAIVSIGSGSVSFGAGQWDGTRIAMTSGEGRALSLEERDRDQMAAALKQQLLDMGKVFTFPPDAVHCVLRAPWTMARMLDLERRTEREEYVTAATLSALARESLENKKIDRDTFLDASVVQTSINGYPTDAPEGKRAHRVGIVALVSLADPTMRTLVKDALASAFPTQRPTMHSGALALFEAVRAARPSLSSAVVMEMTEEGTEAIVVREGTFANEGFTGEGLRSIFDRVSAGSTAEDVRSALALMAQDQCSTELCTRIEEGFAALEPDLAKRFGEFFSALSAERRLPNALLLVTSPDSASWLARFFARIDFTQFTETAQPFEVSLLSPSDIPHASFSSSVLPMDLALTLPLINKEMSGE